MQEVRNAMGKLVCKVDVKSKRIAVVRKGLLTSISFMPDGSLRIRNK